MVTLFQIWLISGLAMLAIVLYAAVGALRQTSTAVRSRVHFSDFVSDEMTSLRSDILAMIERAKPHGRRTMSAGLVVVKRGQELFTNRIFGRMEFEKGRASSFFLKQIVENKENDVERRNVERSV